MYALATTTVSILRGTSVDPVYGDTFATSSIVASTIPASIIQDTQKVTTPGNPTPRITRTFVGIVGSDVDITDADRLRDERTGLVYEVTAVSQQNFPGMTTDQNLTLRRVS